MKTQQTKKKKKKKQSKDDQPHYNLGKEAKIHNEIPSNTLKFAKHLKV